MVQWLIAFSVRQSSLVIVTAGFLLAYAGYKVSEFPVDVFPELNAPTVVVMTEAGGLPQTKSKAISHSPLRRP